MSEDPPPSSAAVPSDTSLPAEARQLLPLVYDELRRLAARRLAQEAAPQSLDATALVHEAYMRLAGQGDPLLWDNRGHFFAAAAESMRRILVERARRRRRIKHGGGLRRVNLNDAVEPVADESADSWDQLVRLDEALNRFQVVDPLAAELTMLHYFGGISLAQAAGLLGMSRATAYRQWAYARSWLKANLDATIDGPESEESSDE
jgi:RNA polymerase sigma factor (TIGR02999 family)